MVNIPAFCDNCGAAFPSGIAVEDCSNIFLHGNKSGPCPRCGGMGSVAEGVFNVTDDAIEVLVASRRTKDSLQKLSNLLKEAAVKKQTADEISSKIEDELPEYKTITNYIPKNATELIAWLTFILIAIQTISDLGKDEKPDVSIIFNQSIEQSIEQKNYYPFIEQEKPLTRNSPCPCGSGKRYKHCHGKAI